MTTTKTTAQLVSDYLTLLDEISDARAVGDAFAALECQTDISRLARALEGHRVKLRIRVGPRRPFEAEGIIELMSGDLVWVLTEEHGQQMGAAGSMRAMEE